MNRLGSLAPLAGAIYWHLSGWQQIFPLEQKQIKKRQNILFMFFSYQWKTEKEKKNILKQRSISSGLPSRTFFGGGWLIFQGSFLTTELPRSLQWPLSPYLAAQLSEMLVRMRSRRERRASVRLTSLNLLLPVEENSTTGSGKCPPTQSYCSQECKPVTGGHISLKNSRGIWCIFLCTAGAESFECHCSIHSQHVKVLYFSFKAI